MALTLDECLDACGITDQICDEVPDSIARTASNIYFAPEDLARLVDALAAADSISVDSLEGGAPTFSMNDSISAGSDSEILPTDSIIEVQDDSKQQRPVAPSTVASHSDTKVPNADIQQHHVKASTDVSPNATVIPDDDNQQQHRIEASMDVLPSDIELPNVDIQQNHVEAFTVILPSVTVGHDDSKQHYPVDTSPVVIPSGTGVPDFILQQNHVETSTVTAIFPSDTEVSDDSLRQHSGKASSVVSPCPIEDHDDDIQPNIFRDSTAVSPNTIEMIEIGDHHMRQHPVVASQSTNVPEEKGIDSYVQIIATLILESPHQKLLVKEMYDIITKNWSKFSLNESTWKNSLRHALSSNSFFVRNGRGPAARAKYWSVHEACVEMFKTGNFRRREARSRVQIMERQTKKRQAKKNSCSQGKTKNMSDGKSDHNKDEAVQQHQFAVNNASSNITELKFPSRTPMSYSAPSIQQQYQQQQQQQHLKYQQLQKQHQVQNQQRSQYHDLFQSQQQKPLQDIQNPQYVEQIEQQLPQAPQHQQQHQQQQLFQHHQRQQQFQYQEQHQYQQQEQDQNPYQQQNQQDQHCLFDNSQNREFQQSYVRSQPRVQDMTSSPTGYYPYDNLRTAMDYNTLNNPAPSQCTSNTGYYNTAQQQQQCSQQY